MNNKLYQLLGLFFISGNVLAASIAKVPATGETGGVTGSGSGVAWPTTRFVVSGDCVTDNLTGLMWPKNGIIGFEATEGGGPISQPNYANTDPTLNNLSWANATIAISNMNSAFIKLCGYSDWRLPNKVELKSLVNYGNSNPANWLIVQGFSSVQADNYWSSSSYAPNTNFAWYVYFNDGYVGADDKTGNGYVWPVRAGQ
ncbi:DUF1566 domain-containing protein [Aquella oligotrophica]|uniref:Lcl C-terminal domain-containing protein n=1 Tax=Aquella oligotrophica TaxID=2067065 RepID=A0A2I7N819_9NEIS|nr:DUF1566 domain-containing protein [Aquella oligotrophica]AUR52607.1 hypothetical protein CUN60_09970 [Aquella oligotrophica]